MQHLLAASAPGGTQEGSLSLSLSLSPSLSLSTHTHTRARAHTHTHTPGWTRRREIWQSCCWKRDRRQPRVWPLRTASLSAVARARRTNSRSLSRTVGLTNSRSLSRPQTVSHELYVPVTTSRSLFRSLLPALPTPPTIFVTFHNMAHPVCRSLSVSRARS